MSLRAQIHDTLDQVTPPAPDLERRVTSFVFAGKTERDVLRLRPRRSPRIFQLRGAAVLLAAALVIVLVVGLILGGRFLRDFHNSPVPGIDHSVLRQLEARPLVALPSMPSSGECPVGPVGDNFIGGSAIGDGTVRSLIGGTPTVYHSDWGTWNALWFAVNPTARGLFLVRARDVQTGKTVFFAGNLSGISDANIGRAILTGPPAGHDRVNGQDVPLRPELVINASAPSDFYQSRKAPSWGAYVGYPRSATACTVFQVDHLGFNQPETFVRPL